MDAIDDERREPMEAPVETPAAALMPPQQTQGMQQTQQQQSQPPPQQPTRPRAAYRLEHVTQYDYAAPVPTSQHVAYLQPRALPRQQVRAHELIVEPTPTRSSWRIDYFGNGVSYFSVLKPHAQLRVSSRSVVDVEGRDATAAIDPAASPPWEAVRDSLRYTKGRAAREADVSQASQASQFAYPSPYVALDDDIALFARRSFAPGRTLLAAAIDLMARIHGEFTFDPSATTITTPVSRVLVERRGVCQDLAHLQIACLRSLGLAARYVSGYLLTDPPPGQPRLVGADASHAWLSVHCPVHGWVDLDPTNAVLPDLRHITLAWGRDYGDVSPLRGVILGGMADTHTLRVGVSVVPIDT